MCFFRCPFVAINGSGDVFQNCDELKASVREELAVDDQVIPELQIKSSRGKGRNAFLLDYYRDKSVKKLLKCEFIVCVPSFRSYFFILANYMRDHYAWDHINDFSLTLKALKTAFQEESDDDRFVMLLGEISDRFKK
jgi:hypothetical protein